AANGNALAVLAEGDVEDVGLGIKETKPRRRAELSEHRRGAFANLRICTFRGRLLEERLCRLAHDHKLLLRFIAFLEGLVTQLYDERANGFLIDESLLGVGR